MPNSDPPRPVPLRTPVTALDAIYPPLNATSVKMGFWSIDSGSGTTGASQPSFDSEKFLEAHQEKIITEMVKVLSVEFVKKQKDQSALVRRLKKRVEELEIQSGIKEWPDAPGSGPVIGPADFGSNIYGDHPDFRSYMYSSGYIYSSGYAAVSAITPVSQRRPSQRRS